MDLPMDLKIIHQPIRLQIVRLLYQQGDISAVTTRQSLSATAGNIDSHVRRLQKAGIVTIRNALMSGGFESRYELTRDGVARFERYLDWLESFLAMSR